MSATHTLAMLELTPAAFNEIKTKLFLAGYNHAFDGELIDMSGIGVVEDKAAQPWVMPSPLVLRTRSG